MQRIKVTLIAVRPVIRAGLLSLLTADRGLILEAETESMSAALELKPGKHAQVALIELPLNRGSDLQDLRRLSAGRPDLAPVVFTSSEQATDLLNALAAGARGYVLKSATPEVLANALRAASVGDDALQVPRRLLLTALEGRAPGGTLNLAQRRNPLTPREGEILDLMATGALYRDIAVELNLAESTIKKYAHSVIGKLGASCRATAVLTAHRMELLGSRAGSPSAKTDNGPRVSGPL